MPLKGAKAQKLLFVATKIYKLSNADDARFLPIISNLFKGAVVMRIVYEELIIVDLQADSAEDVIRQVGKIMLENGFVKDSYIAAALAREIEYPTGLQLESIGIAMPHTSCEHVEKAAVCIARLANPVSFAHMGTPEVNVEAELVFMMAVIDPQAQLDNLQKILTVFSNEDIVNAFLQAESKDALYQVALTYLNDNKEERG
jgi:PTS system galactitol-specific IIA component